MENPNSYQSLLGNNDLHRPSLREIYPAGFLLPEEGSRPFPVSAPFYSRPTRVPLLSRYGAILFPDGSDGGSISPRRDRSISKFSIDRSSGQLRTW